MAGTLEIVSEVTVGPVSSTEVGLQWSQPISCKAALTYQVKRSELGRPDCGDQADEQRGGDPISCYTGPDTFCTISGLCQFTSYRFIISAMTRFGRTSELATVTCATREGLAPCPTGVASNFTGFTVQTNGRPCAAVDVTWELLQASSVPGVLLGYEISYRKKEMGVGVAWEISRSGPSATSCKLEGLEVNQTYEISVAAITKAGRGAQAPVIQLSTGKNMVRVSCDQDVRPSPIPKLGSQLPVWTPPVETAIDLAAREAESRLADSLDNLVEDCTITMESGTSAPGQGRVRSRLARLHSQRELAALSEKPGGSLVYRRLSTEILFTKVCQCNKELGGWGGLNLKISPPASN